MNNRWTESGSGSADWLVNAVTKNPEGLLLLAAGCALVLRSASSRNVQRSREQRDGSRNDRWQMPESASQIADTARDFIRFAQGRNLAGALVVLDSNGGSVHGAIALLINLQPQHWPHAPAAPDLVEQVVDATIRGFLAEPAAARRRGR